MNINARSSSLTNVLCKCADDPPVKAAAVQFRHFFGAQGFGKQAAQPAPLSWLILHTIENSDLKNLAIFHTFQMTYIASHSLRTRSPCQSLHSAEAYSHNPNVLKEDNHFHKGALRFLPAKLISLQDTCQYISWNVNCAEGGRGEKGINIGEENRCSNHTNKDKYRFFSREIKNSLWVLFCPSSVSSA